MKNVLGIIMGGGRGERLFPLTQLRSKPAVPLAGKYRIIDIPVSNCLNSGINKMFVLTQFNSASLNKHVVQTYKFDLFNGGFLDILAAEQTRDSTHWFEGTADAVRQTIKHFAPFDVEYILILSGDQLYQMDFQKVLKFHIEKDADITVAAMPVTAKETAGMGIMKIEENGRTTTFHEKPEPEALENLRCPVSLSPGEDPEGHDFLANMGIYLFRKKFLIDLLLESDALDFGKELIPQAIGVHKVFSYIFNGYWTDIGTIRSFYDANLDLTSGLPDFNFYEAQMPVYTHPRNLPGSKLNSCHIHQSIVSEGCILNGADIRRSIVGVRGRVGTGTTIKNSIVMGADWYETAEELENNSLKQIPNIGIGSHCTIINAIIDKNARVGDNVSIINAHNQQEKDTESYSIRDGLIVVPKGSLIPTGTVI